jgi:Na+/H+ antiporter NhaD/arsenite permease-like protein
MTRGGRSFPQLDRTGIAVLGAIALIAAAAGLSSVFSNDVVCLATAPVLIDICLNRRLDPVPFLLALSYSSNIGSAATLIGNPQNMLIGESLKMSFIDNVRDAVAPVDVGLALTRLLIALLWRGRWAFDPFLAAVDGARASNDTHASIPGRRQNSRQCWAWWTGRSF